MNDIKDDLKTMLPDDSHEVLLAALALAGQYEQDRPDEELVDKLDRYFSERGIEGNDRQEILFEYLMENDPREIYALNLGINCLKKKEYASAFRWLCRAKELEDPRKIPQLHLYLYGAYAWGLGTEKNEEKAYELLQEFCDYISPCDYDFSDEDERKITAMMYSELGDICSGKGKFHEALVSYFEAFLWDENCENILPRFKEKLSDSCSDDSYETIMDDLFIRHEETRKLFLEMLYSDREFSSLAGKLRNNVLIENRISF